MAKKQPWERTDKESSQSFEAFQVYRDMGTDRSLAKVGEQLGKSTALMERWSSTHGWRDRAADYDSHLDRLTLKEEAKERIKMAKRHAQQAMMFQNKVLQRLNALDPAELSPNDLIRFFDTSVKIERLSRGDSTESINHSGGTVVQIIDDLDELEE